MAVTEVTSESWFSRLMGSIKSVVVGLALFGLSFPLLFWNEGRAVRTAKSLEEGAGAVQSVSADRVDASNEGKLVHMTGNATTSETLADPDFGVSANAIKLTRDVEMYQWAETKKSETRNKTGGGTETVTTYDYEKKWSSDRIDSSSFKESVGHANPAGWPFESWTGVAQKVTAGAFTLSQELVGRLGETQALRVDDAAVAKVSPALKGKLKANDGSLYLGANPGSPAIGDVRVSFKTVNPATVSLVARQVGETFEPYHAQAGDDILLLKYGTLSADAMFKAAQAENAMLTWILRGVGFFMMFIGLRMLFSPLVVFADVIPFMGTLLGAGLGLFAGLTAAVLSLLTIAVAWIFFRPLIGIALFALAVGGIVLLVRKAMQAKQLRQAARPGAVA
jgi:hypothetical protein